MRKNILGAIFVFTFTFISIFLVLDNKETYAISNVDSRFDDDAFYNCVRREVGESGIQSDGYTFKDSALNNITELNCYGREIYSTKGIKLLKNLVELDMRSNKLKKINLSKNTKLKKLFLDYNKLTNIDLSKNTKLESVDLSKNKLTKIDVSNNTELTHMNLSINKLKNINLSNNSKLNYLLLQFNELTNIDLSKNTKLKNLYMDSNKLTNIDLSKNTELTSIILDRNKLTNIDLSKNTELKFIGLSENKLKSIDLSMNKKLEELYLSDNYFSKKPSKCIELGDKCSFGYIVKFNSNGGNTVSSQNISYKLKSSPSVTREDYKFLGWYKDSNLSEPATFPLEVTSDITLYAKWKYIGTGDQISLIYECGSNNCFGLPSTVSVPKPASGERKTIKISEIEPKSKNSNYVFWYWTNSSQSKKYKSDCSGLSNCKTKISISKTNTLHAVWKIIPDVAE